MPSASNNAFLGWMVPHAEYSQPTLSTPVERVVRDRRNIGQPWDSRHADE
jgi:hypothetical protein